MKRDPTKFQVIEEDFKFDDNKVEVDMETSELEE